MPVVRSPAQIEAARRNGAKSRGPVTDDGKARSRMNALRHGLSAKEHLLLDGEDPAAWDELLVGLVSQLEPETVLEAELVRRLASALWRQDRADRLEQALFVAAPRPRFITEQGFVDASPEETFDLARFAAITRYRAEASREASRLMRELRLLRAERRDEPEHAVPPSRRPSAGPEGLPTRDKPLPGLPRPAARPVEPGNDNEAAAAATLQTEPEPPASASALNRQQRRRLAALARLRA